MDDLYSAVCQNMSLPINHPNFRRMFNGCSFINQAFTGVSPFFSGQMPGMGTGGFKTTHCNENTCPTDTNMFPSHPADHPHNMYGKKVGVESIT